MSDLPTGTVTVAVILSVISLSAILVGVPLMLNDLVNLQLEFGLKSQAHLDMSNVLWRDIMKEVATIGQWDKREQKQTIRKRRQCAKGTDN